MYLNKVFSIMVAHTLGNNFQFLIFTAKGQHSVILYNVF